ncbi:tyrosine-type recombinase/integrase [Methylobacterium sp. D54C]
MTRPLPRASLSLHTAQGRRKYLTPGERLRFLEAAAQEPGEVETLCLTLIWTGCRISEALGLTHADLDHENRTVTVRCLKKRRTGVVREVPVPAHLLATLARIHGHGAPDARLWPIARSTAWRDVKAVMASIGVGSAASSPKGLRHTFGVHAVRSGVPLNLLQRWLGHASMATTAIYANVMGAEEQEIAARMW